MSPPFADRFWTSHDGLQLHARDYAAAPGPARLPVVCLHGLTRNARDFEDLAPRLAAQGRRILAPDVRGRGASAWDPNPLNYHVGTYAQDVLGLLDALGVARAVFIGTSMGGLITMALAMTQGPAVAAAVINDIGPGVSTAGLARIGDYLGVDPGVKDWDEAAAYVAHINGPAYPAYQQRDWARFARRVFAARDGALRLDYDPAVAQLGRLPEGAPAPDLWPMFGALVFGRQVLLLRGELSDLMPEESARLICRTAPTVTCIEVDGVGHAPSLEEPEALAAIDAFMQDQP